MGFDLTSTRKSAAKLLSRGFKPDKCKTSLGLVLSRIKLLRNKKAEAVVRLKREVAQLLADNQDQVAGIRVEHIINEEKTMSAYELLGLYGELILSRLDIIESQKSCTGDLKEAISSMVFASQRCGDIPELMDVCKHFLAKYGKEFIASAIEVRSDSGVNPMIIGKLSVASPDIKRKVEVLTMIATENGINWEPSSSEEQARKTDGNLMSKPQGVPMYEPIRLVEDGKESKIVTESVDVQFCSHSIPTQEPYVKVAVHKFTKLEAASDSFSANNSSPRKSHPESGSQGYKSEESDVYKSSREDAISQPSQNLEFQDATSAAVAAIKAAERASIAATAASILVTRGSDPRDDFSESLKSSMSSKSRKPVTKDSMEDADAEWACLAARAAVLLESRGSYYSEGLFESHESSTHNGHSSSTSTSKDHKENEFAADVDAQRTTNRSDFMSEPSFDLFSQEEAVMDMIVTSGDRMKNADNASGKVSNIQVTENDEVKEIIFSSMHCNANEYFGSARSSSSRSVSSPSGQFNDGVSTERDVDIFSQNTMFDDSKTCNSIHNERGTWKDGFDMGQWVCDHTSDYSFSMPGRNSLENSDVKTYFPVVEIANQGMETISHFSQENVVWKTDKYASSSLKTSCEDPIYLKKNNQKNESHKNENFSFISGQEIDQSLYKTQSFKDQSPVVFDDYVSDHDNHEETVDLTNGSSNELIFSHQRIGSSEFFSSVVPSTVDACHGNDLLVKESSISYAYPKKEQSNDGLPEEMSPPTFDYYESDGSGSDSVEDVNNVLNHKMDSGSSSHVHTISNANCFPTMSEQESLEHTLQKNDVNASNRSAQEHVLRYYEEEQAEPESGIVQEQHASTRYKSQQVQLAETSSADFEKEGSFPSYCNRNNYLENPSVLQESVDATPEVMENELLSEYKFPPDGTDASPLSSRIPDDKIARDKKQSISPEYSQSSGFSEVDNKMQQDNTGNEKIKKTTMPFFDSDSNEDENPRPVACRNAGKKLYWRTKDVLPKAKFSPPSEDSEQHSLQSNTTTSKTAASYESLTQKLRKKWDMKNSPLEISPKTLQQTKNSNENLRLSLHDSPITDASDSYTIRKSSEFSSPQILAKKINLKFSKPESEANQPLCQVQLDKELAQEEISPVNSSSGRKRSPKSFALTSYKHEVDGWDSTQSREEPPLNVQQDKGSAVEILKHRVHGLSPIKSSESMGTTKPHGLASYKNMHEKQELGFQQSKLTLSQSNSVVDQPSCKVQSEEECLELPGYGSSPSVSKGKRSTELSGQTSHKTVVDKQDAEFLPPKQFQRCSLQIPSDKDSIQGGNLDDKQAYLSPPLEYPVEPTQVPLGKDIKQENALRSSVPDSSYDVSLCSSEDAKLCDPISHNSVDKKWNSKFVAPETSNAKSSPEILMADDITQKEVLISSQNVAANTVPAESVSSAIKQTSIFGWSSNFAGYFRSNS